MKRAILVLLLAGCGAVDATPAALAAPVVDSLSVCLSCVDPGVLYCAAKTRAVYDVEVTPSTLPVSGRTYSERWLDGAIATFSYGGFSYWTTPIVVRLAPVTFYPEGGCGPYDAVCYAIERSDGSRVAPRALRARRADGAWTTPATSVSGAFRCFDPGSVWAL